MNILLLTNSAPNYFHVFNALARRFMADGHSVIAAVDSNFSHSQNGLASVGFSEIHNFQAFFATHQTDPGILRRYGDINLNHALLSDFERAQVYGIWGDGANVDFFDRLKSGLLTFYEQIFDRHGIDLVLYENVSNTLSYFAWIVAQRRGARYAGLIASRLPGRFAITDHPVHDDAAARAFAAIRSGEVTIPADLRQWADEYIAGIDTIQPDYMKSNGLDQIAVGRRYLNRTKLTKLARLFRTAGDSRTEAFQIGNPLRTHLNLFGRNLSRRLRASRVRQFYESPRADEDFLLYPLHFHPESSTSILAGTYLDEYEVIRNIAFSLPEGVRLYVKDHQSAWAYPSLDFYRRVKRLPNVRLLPPEAPTKQLIRQSRAVITLTSTVGYEALLLKKRVILFGSVFYDFHRGVTPVDDPRNLHALISRTIAAAPDWTDADNNDFVCAYHAATLPGSLNLTQAEGPAQAVAAQVYPLLCEWLKQPQAAGGVSSN